MAIMTQMGKNLFFTLIAMMIAGLLSSCSESNKISKEEFAKENLNEQINYIFTCFSDTNTVSRMLDATPKHIRQIQAGEAVASSSFKDRVTALGNFYIDSDYNNPKNLREYDPDFSWYDKVWDMDALYGWYWFWGGLIVLFILSGIIENAAPLTAGTIFYFGCGLMSYIAFSNSDPVEKESQPSVETIKTVQITAKPETAAGLTTAEETSQGITAVTLRIPKKFASGYDNK